MKRIHSLAALVAVGLAAPASAQTAPPVPAPLYTLDSATVLPSTDTDWDYMKLEPHGTRMFIARRKDGLTVYDVATKKVLGTVANSVGANGPLLLPQYNRGYVAMTDGSLLSFNLKTLAVIDRIKLAEDGGLNTVSFDPSTKRLQAIVGSRPAESAWFTLDAATGKLLGKTVFPFKKMDEPSSDGKGTLWAPARYDNILLKLDGKTLKETARYPIDCVQVVAVEYHHATDRLLIGCRGDKPVFIALDPATGKQIAKLPIGNGIDGMAVDEKRGRILTSNGGNSSLSVIQRDGRDGYRLLGNVQTRPQARIMALDERDGRVHLVTADATMPAPDDKGVAPAPYFHPNSFVVLTYAPK